MRLRRAAPALVLLPLLALMCATATEISVDIYSDVDCTKNAEVGLIMGGKLTDLQTNALSSTAVHCDPSQRVGRIVIAPSGDHDEELAFEVITRNDDQALESCTAANNYKGCIVARRQLRFEPHTALDVRVDLRRDCLDKPCDPSSTCIHGGCYSAVCPATGCATDDILSTGLDGGASVVPEAGSSDASVSDVTTTTQTPEGSVDAGAKCPAPAAATAGSRTVVANTGSVLIPTGLGVQNHLFFAANDCRYWYFHIDAATTRLHTMVSKDLLTWDAGPDIRPGGNDLLFNSTSELAKTNGGNFSIAYRDFNGVDTFHMVIDQPTTGGGGPTGYPFDVRFTLAGPTGAAIPTMPVLHQLVPTDHGVNGGNCQNTDGPAVAYSEDGHVYISSGWYFEQVRGTYCDMNVYVSADAETGTGDWSKTDFAWSGYFITAHFTMSRLLIPLPGPQTVYGAFAEPETAGGFQFYNSGWITNLHDWDGGYDGSVRTPTWDSADAGNDVFDNANTNISGSNDWNVCVVTTTDGHALRRLSGGSFEARKLTASGWIADTAPNNVLSGGLAKDSADVYGSGLVIMSDGELTHGLTAFATTGPYTQIMVSHYSTTTGWSPWESFVSPTAGTERKWLSGTGCKSSRPILTWTETTGGTPSIVAMDVSASFKAN